jgi:hypothetical protein
MPMPTEPSSPDEFYVRQSLAFAEGNSLKTGFVANLGTKSLR